MVRPHPALVAEVRRRLRGAGFDASNLEIDASLIAVADQPDLEVNRLRLIDRIPGDVIREQREILMRAEVVDAEGREIKP